MNAFTFLEARQPKPEPLNDGRTGIAWEPLTLKEKLLAAVSEVPNCFSSLQEQREILKTLSRARAELTFYDNRTGAELLLDSVKHRFLNCDTFDSAIFDTETATASTTANGTDTQTAGQTGINNSETPTPALKKAQAQQSYFAAVYMALSGTIVFFSVLWYQAKAK